MALRDQPYLPLYVQDYLTDEKLRECLPESVGVYSFLMCLMHKSDEYGVILLKQKDKQSDKQILNFAKKIQKHLPYCVDIIENAINDLIQEGVLIHDNDKLLQKRMVRDNALSITRSESGKKGAFAKANQQANGIAKSQANTEYENENDTENDTDIVIDIKDEERKIKAAEREKQFSDFWDYYGKKVDSKKCREKFLKLSEPELNKIRETLPAYIKSTPEIKFRKNPLTYLNGKCWNDEPVIEKTSFEKTCEALRDWDNPNREKSETELFGELLFPNRNLRIEGKSE